MRATALRVASPEDILRELTDTHLRRSPAVADYLIAQMLATSGTYETLRLILDALGRRLEDTSLIVADQATVDRWATQNTDETFPALMQRLCELDDDFLTTIGALAQQFQGRVVESDGSDPAVHLKIVPRPVYSEHSATYLRIFACAYAMLLGLE